MIKLQGDRVVVRDGGQGITLDLGQWRRMLHGCCRAAGLHDGALTDDLLHVVRQFCRERQRHGPPAELAEVDALIVQALVDAGLRDLALAWREARRLRPPEAASPRMPLARLDLEAMLRGDPYFLPKPLGELVTQVAESLRRLGLTHASREFVVALARELWWEHEQALATVPRHDYWLISPDDIAALVAEHAAPALLAASLTVRPVSTLFPAIRAELNIAQAARRLSPGELTELLVLPAFAEQCAALAALLERLARLAAQRQAMQPRGTPATTVTWLGFGNLVDGLLPMGASAAAQLRHDLLAIARERLAEFAGLQVEMQ